MTKARTPCIGEAVNLYNALVFFGIQPPATYDELIERRAEFEELIMQALAIPLDATA